MHVRQFSEQNSYPCQLPAFKLPYELPELAVPCPIALRSFVVNVDDRCTIKDARKQLHAAYQIHIQRFEAAVQDLRLNRMR